MKKQALEVSVKRKSLVRDIPGGKLYVTGSAVPAVKIGTGKTLKSKAAALSTADRMRAK